MKINGWVIGGVAAVAVVVAAAVMLRKPKAAPPPVVVQAPAAPKPNGTAAVVNAAGALVGAGLSVFNAGTSNGWW